MTDLSKTITAAIRTAENQRLLQAQPAFRAPGKDDRFTVLLRRLDTAERKAA